MTAKSALYCLAAASLATVSLVLATEASADWPPPPPPPPYVPAYLPPPPPPYLPPPPPPYGYGYPGQTPIQMDPTPVPPGSVPGGGPNELGGSQASTPVMAGGPDELGGGQAAAPVIGGGPDELGGGQPSAPVMGGGDLPGIYVNPEIWLQDPIGDDYRIPSPRCGCSG